jgi:hypothetical protein
MAVKVRVETETWMVKEPDPADEWDHGTEDGFVALVEAEYVNEPATENRTFYGRSGMRFIFDCDAVPGDMVFVVVADYRSTSTFGTTAGYFHVLAVTKSYEDAVGLATAARGAQGSLLEHEGVTYYTPWTGTCEELNDVWVWDCHLLPRLD